MKRQSRPQERTFPLLHDIIRHIGSPAWDILIIGDGSGTGWGDACGWASVLISNRLQARRFFYGGMDCGSINMAEMLPYAQALSWYDAFYGKDQLKQLQTLNVHILTDSQTIAQWGTYAMRDAPAPLPRKAIALSGTFRAFKEVGYHCHFHWAPRMSTDINWASDLIAGLCRREILDRMGSTGLNGNDPATRAAEAIGRMRFCNPQTGELLDPYTLSPAIYPPGIPPQV